MWNSKEMESLQNLSKTLSEKLNVDLKLFDEINKKALDELPDEQKGEIEKLVAIKNKALILAKEGKQEEALNVIKEMKNGYKCK